MGAEARYWAIVDLETTGVDPVRHEIVQLARVVIDTVEQEIIPRLTFVAYIKPTRWRNREREAMEVNRLTLAKLKAEGADLCPTLRAFCWGPDWGNTVLAGWGVSFEERFLRAGFKETSRAFPFPFQTIDIRSMAQLGRARRGKSKLLGLRDAGERLGVTVNPDQLHDALYDATITAEIALQLLKKEDKDAQ